ncbi:11892_t:CDS:2, partial [Funneliformis geosporum]
MERLIVSNPDVSPGGTYEYKEIHFDELIKTIAHELAHAYQFTINSKIEGEKSSCESSGKKDANGIFLYPALVAEHTQLTEEIKQIITSSPYYQEFKACENTFGFDYCFECRQEKKELEDLIVWLENSQNLASLEKNYQEIKKKSLYDANKKTLDKNQNNKELIDNYYAKKMIDLKFPNSDASNFNYVIIRQKLSSSGRFKGKTTEQISKERYDKVLEEVNFDYDKFHEWIYQEENKDKVEIVKLEGSDFQETGEGTHETKGLINEETGQIFYSSPLIKEKLKLLSWNGDKPLIDSPTHIGQTWEKGKYVNYNSVVIFLHGTGKSRGVFPEIEKKFPNTKFIYPYSPTLQYDMWHGSNKAPGGQCEG